MTKRLKTTCDHCGKELGDYGWLDCHIEKVGPYSEVYGYTQQFCNRTHMAAWASSKKPFVIQD
jgi:hypothetical protein